MTKEERLEKQRKNFIRMQEYENALYENGNENGRVKYIAGVDEVGRGPLAGPVCAAAVILPQNAEIPWLNDSKKLSEKRREEVFDEIADCAVSFGVAFASVEEIEEFNILNATFMAMNRAIAELEPVPELAIIDGNNAAGVKFPNRTIIKGDGCCASIAAASVLAKVTRDRYMYDMDALYPEYGFAKHKGYGTAAHYEALRKYGPSPIHRMSFLRKMH